MRESDANMTKLMEQFKEMNKTMVDTNARAQRAEDTARTLAGQLEEARRQTRPSGRPSNAMDVRTFSAVPKGKKRLETRTIGGVGNVMDVCPPSIVGRSGRGRTEAPQEDAYEGGDESDSDRDEVKSLSSFDCFNKY